MNLIQRAFVAVALVAGLAGSCCAADLLVPGSFASIQNAIDAASAGDRVLVAPGTYPERLDLQGKAISVIGVGGADATVVDAQGQGPVVTCDSGETPATVLRGLTLINGSAVEGGGLLLRGSSPSLLDLTVRSNTATTPPTTRGGGGLAVTFGSSPLVVNCRFLDNTTAGIGSGVVVLHSGSEPRLVGCVIARNGGGLTGGVAVELGSAVEMINCTIADNEGSLAGGICVLGASVTLRNSIVDRHGVNVLRLGGAPVTATYCLIGGGFPGEGNVGGGSALVPPTYELDGSSLAIGGADLGLLPADVLDADSDGDTTELLPIDAMGRPRVVDGPFGLGVSALDIGAVEFAMSSQTGCNAADVAAEFGVLNANDVIDFVNGFNGMTGAGDVSPPGGDGLFNANDVIDFVNAFNAGCP